MAVVEVVTETRQWVRLVDGKLVLTWREIVDLSQQGGEHVDHRHASVIRNRPLTRRERLAWYWLTRTPQP